MALRGGNAGDYREYADRPEFDVDRLTIGVWVRPHTTVTSSTLISRGTTGSDGQWLLAVSTTPAIWRFVLREGGAARIAADTTPFDADRLFHLAARYDGANVSLSVYEAYTGVRRNITGSALTGDLTDLVLPIRLFERTSGANHLDCDMSDLACWGAALTDGQIAMLQHRVRPDRIRRDALFLYDPLISRGSRERMGAVTTDAGTLIPADHPRLWEPSLLLPPIPYPAPAVQGAATVAAQGSVSAEGYAVQQGGATVAGQASLLAAGYAVPVGAASVQAAGSVLADGYAVAQGAAIVSAAGSVTVAGRTPVYYVRTRASRTEPRGPNGTRARRTDG